jgi:hypothetical protein
MTERQIYDMDKGLQKFTKLKGGLDVQKTLERNTRWVSNPEDFVTTPEEDQMILRIMQGEKWTKKDFINLPPEERMACAKVFAKAMNTLAQEDRDLFLNKIDDALANDNKRDLWEQNHFRILGSIDKITRKYNRFPSRSELSRDTGLSRVTIGKHLKQYLNSEAYQEKREEYIIMREALLARVYKLAVDHDDTRATKLFLEATAQMEQPANVNIRNQQNNFIQINGLSITQQQLEQLPVEKQQQLKDILFATLETKAV